MGLSFFHISGERFAVMCLEVMAAEVIRSCQWRLMDANPAMKYFPVPYPSDGLPLSISQAPPFRQRRVTLWARGGPVLDFGCGGLYLTINYHLTKLTYSRQQTIYYVYICTSVPQAIGIFFFSVKRARKFSVLYKLPDMTLLYSRKIWLR